MGTSRTVSEGRLLNVFRRSARTIGSHMTRPDHGTLLPQRHSWWPVQEPRENCSVGRAPGHGKAGRVAQSGSAHGETRYRRSCERAWWANQLYHGATEPNAVASPGRRDSLPVGWAVRQPRPKRGPMTTNGSSALLPSPDGQSGRPRASPRLYG